MLLTNEQLASLWQTDGSPVQGLRAISARPGTGKTSTVTEYCIAVMEGWNANYSPWQGMAALSYTNVARYELEKKIRRRGTANRILSPPNFIGTIDAFVNQYIFLPFGAGQMDFQGGRPRLVGEPYSQWRVSDELSQSLPSNASSPLYFDCYSFDSGNAPIVVDRSPRKVSFKGSKSAAQPTPANTAKIACMKRHVWTQGLATQNDANYLAYRVLAGSPTLVRSLVRRFPVLIIDEAQDMTAVQHALLDCLIAAGQKHVVIVGDEYQAIYEWNTAKPQLFTARKADPRWEIRALSATFRCSPAICSVLTNMAADGETIHPAASGKNKDYVEAVRIQGYDRSDEQSEVTTAIDELAKVLSGRPPHDDPDGLKTIAVIARSGDSASCLQAYFTGLSTMPKRPLTWESRLTKDYLRVVHNLLKKDLHAAVGAYETLLFNAGDFETKSGMRAALAQQWGNGGSDLLTYRVIMLSDLQKIAATLPAERVVNVAACTPFCNVELRALSRTLLTSIGRDCKTFSSNAKRDQDRPLSSLFASLEDRTYFVHPNFPDVRVTFSTVHGVKGETHDGVLFYTKEKSNGCGCPSGASSLWAKILSHNLVECEHKRIAYVALSRAAQVLFVLAPKSSVTAWETLL